MATITAVYYDPAHQYQLSPADPHGGVNCSAYTLAMAIDGTTIGALRVTGATVRALSNEPTPDPASPGLNIPQLVAVSKHLRVPINDNTGHSFAQALRNRAASRYILLQGDADQLPAALKCVPFNGPHMILIEPGTENPALTHNPLCHAGVRISVADLRDYAEKYGRDTGLGRAPEGGQAIRYAVTRVTPRIARVAP